MSSFGASYNSDIHHITKQYKKSREIGENILTKSYQDGIIDCLKIIATFTDVGIRNGPYGYIEDKMKALLSTAQEQDNSQHQISLFDITIDDKTTRELNNLTDKIDDFIKRIDDQLDHVKDFE